jgi:hypothetical protein
MFNFVPTVRKSPILFFLPTFDPYGIVVNELKLFCSVRSNMLVEKKDKRQFLRRRCKTYSVWVDKQVPLFIAITHWM